MAHQKMTDNSSETICSNKLFVRLFLHNDERNKFDIAAAVCARETSLNHKAKKKKRIAPLESW